ncbi:hypothetical protein [Paraburkholderia sediminicola]|uniref:hypothetical protein n=1 Tax=Paraburkholderia sediminicola TaxID=458836 RepID=UPI0038B72149
MTLTWGLIGPGALPSERRVRTLGVAASVRRFNELAVPGLGGVWFGKQLFLATLGVKVAELATRPKWTVTNIETANAIEALACWLDFNANFWEPDSRRRGVNKMKGKTDLTFRHLREQKFYVTQPMRMSTVEALPALGLVTATGVRFNTFKCSQEGEEFLEAANANWRPHKKTVIEHLKEWASSNDFDKVRTDHLQAALSPTQPLPVRARALLMERLVRGAGTETTPAKQRRQAALAWVESIRAKPETALGWDTRPFEISEPQHWADMRAGALFVVARDAAIAALDALESCMARDGTGQRHALRSPVPAAVETKLTELKRAADDFLRVNHPDREANEFCIACSSGNSAQVLERLVSLDGRVLRLRGNEVVPGPAFQGVAQASTQPVDDGEQGDDAAVAVPGIVWPLGLSFRVKNLFLLNADLRGELDQWLNLVPTLEEAA